MTESQRRILAAERLAGEQYPEGTTAYDCFLNGCYRIEIQMLCDEKAKVEQDLDSFRTLLALKASAQ